MSPFPEKISGLSVIRGNRWQGKGVKQFDTGNELIFKDKFAKGEKQMCPFDPVKGGEIATSCCSDWAEWITLNSFLKCE